MPITDYKVTDLERDAVYVQSQNDTLSGTAAQNKAVFDAYPELIRDNLDGLCDFISEFTFSHTVTVAAGTNAKTPTITTFVPIGAVIELIFNEGNTAASPTISIDGVTHSISGLPTTAKVSTSTNQTYRVKKTGADTLVFIRYPDYICEYGTSSSWVYERYAGGNAKCWIKGGSVTFGNGVAFGALYLRSTTGTNGVGLAMPAVFNAVPMVFATFTTSASTIIGVHGWAAGSSPYTAHAQHLASSSTSSGTAGTVDFNAIGTWK